MKKTKILLIGPNLNFLGGVANYYKHILPELKRDKNFEINYLSIGSEKNPKLKLISPIIDLIKVLFFIILKKPNIVHVNPSLNIKSLLRDSIFIFIANAFKKKTIVFFRGWNKQNEYYFEKKSISFITKNIFKANSYIVLNDHVENFLLNKKISKININRSATTIPNEYADNTYKKIKKKNKPLKILFLSRVEKTKGLYELLEAIKRFNGEIELTIVGDGSIWDDLNRKIKNENLQDFVKQSKSRIGQEKLNSYLTNDVFILPSYSEGMPNSILEAMSLGLIVIGTNVGAIPQLILSHGGILIEAKDYKSIENGFNNLLENYQLLFNKAEESSTIVKKTYSSRSIANKLLNIYKQQI